MPKTVGLSQQHKKYLQIFPFSKKNTLCSASFYNHAKSFYNIFRQAFGNGSKIILNTHIPNTQNLGVCLVNYHFAVELILKSLICLNNPSFDKEELKTHDLIELLKIALPHYSVLSKISDNGEYILLLEELSIYFSDIRYAQTTISLSHNKKRGWKDKTPLQELSEILHDIFLIPLNAFEKAAKYLKSARTPVKSSECISPPPF
ncbi:MAG: hypothetical protein K1000chlam1_01248 [Candidatus Anoxychlamydiales bacterium]|nr:hypothetical protein [Candidatus Anoxychlamydiales bacterium]